MIIHIEICDICGRRTDRVETFSAEKNGKKYVWDVGVRCCMNTRFQIRDHRNVDTVLTVQA